MSRPWTGIVLRPPDAGWDGMRSTGSVLQDVDDSAVADIGVQFRIVRDGQFLAVAAPSEDVARHVAARLRVSWRPAGALQAAPAAKDGGTAADFERRYSWPLPAPAAGSPAWAIARWQAPRLEVWADCHDPRRLRAEIAGLLAVPADCVEIHGRAADGESNAYDAAVDAAVLARALDTAVRVQAPLRTPAAPLSLRYRAWCDGAGPNRWACAGGLPLDDRPAAASVQAGLACAQAGIPRAPADTRGADTRGADIYGVEYEEEPPGAPLPLDIRLDREAVAHARAFARECFVDELAAAASADPVQWRLERLADPQGRALVEAVARQSGWQPGAARPGPGRGRGFAYASALDTSSEPPRPAWSAWVVDVSVDPASGHVGIDRLTVGHHVSGMPSLASDPRWQHEIEAAASRLLAPAPAFADWAGPAAAPAAQPAPVVGSLQLVDLPVARAAACGTLPCSPALTLPAAAAMANAIYAATGVRLREPGFDGLGGQVRRSLAGRRRASALRRPLAWAGSAAAALAGLAAAVLPWRAEIPPAAPDPSLYSAAAIERGRLIAAASDCVVCHTAPGGKPNAGGLGLETPFGTVYSTNITPDPDHGIGRWSFEAFDRAMRQGISRDGRHLYPAFPYTSFAKFSDGDMQALYAYLMVQPAVPSEPPQTRLAFPYNLRGMMAGWNLLFHDDSRFEPDPSRSALWNRGAYLVQGAGHCGACHTPRNALGAEKSGLRQFLAGAQVEHWDAPALNTLSSSPLPWTRQDMYDYLRTGFSARHGAAAGPMGPVVAGLQALPDQDILAMATYLTELPGTPAAATAVAGAPDSRPAAAPPAPAAASPRPDPAQLLAMPGRHIYEGSCAACHDPARGSRLFGVRPDLALSTGIASARPDNLVQVILHGIPAPADDALGYMPGFADSLDDDQIVDLVDYLRARYGNGAPPWPDAKSTVQRLRAQPPAAGAGAGP